MNFLNLYILAKYVPITFARKKVLNHGSLNVPFVLQNGRTENSPSRTRLFLFEEIFQVVSVFSSFPLIQSSYVSSGLVGYNICLYIASKIVITFILSYGIIEIRCQQSQTIFF
jgi:hypothetical protein